ncbi:MAG: transcription elongation factor GreA [Eubacterium sp.]|jgi:transcription elongation factor GreA|nr:transcription elongation factor GreA [Eubacterium sp.]
MTQKQTVLTKAGMEKLNEELEMLKTVKRRDIAEKIKIALSFGDLSENSEYDEAKNEQGMVEARIAEIENILGNIVLLDEESLTTEIVHIGNKVRLKNLSNNQELNLSIVGSKEVDMKNHRISDESPIGAAIMGRQVSDVVEVQAPAGTIKYEILEISK